LTRQPDTRPTVLMVEDNAEVLLLGATVLEDAGYAVVTATSADEALAKIHAGMRIDLLFTDIVMPGRLDGAALAVAVGEILPGTPILLTTGWADREAEHAEGRAVWPLIGKPYRPADLVRRVEALLEGH